MATFAHGIMFHHFHGPGHRSSQGSISGAQLADLIEFVGHARILQAREWLARAQAGKLGRNDICLTFDDSLRCQYDIALDVLREYDLTAFWFVYTSVLQGCLERLEVYRKFRHDAFETMEMFYDAFFETVLKGEGAAQVREALKRTEATSYLSEFSFYTAEDRRFRYMRDEVLGPQRYNAVMDRMMAEAGVDPMAVARGLWMDADSLLDLHRSGHVVGLHSHTHPTRLEHLEPAEQGREYRKNFECLSGLLGEAPVAMSHPSNSYTQETLAILRALGIRVGFRANMAMGLRSVLELPREDHVNVLKEMMR